MRRGWWGVPTRMWVWDDRGQRVTARPDVAWSRLSPERRRAACIAARGDPLLGFRVWHLAALIALTAPVAFIWWFPVPVLLIAVPLWFAAMIVAHASYTFPMVAYAVSVRTLAAGCCPGCGYELAALPTDEDGCTQCPECAAAWRRA